MLKRMKFYELKKKNYSLKILFYFLRIYFLENKI
jgi:hypothetical protein